MDQKPRNNYTPSPLLTPVKHRPPKKDKPWAIIIAAVVAIVIIGLGIAILSSNHKKTPTKVATSSKSSSSNTNSSSSSSNTKSPSTPSTEPKAPATSSDSAAPTPATPTADAAAISAVISSTYDPLLGQASDGKKTCTTDPMSGYSYNITDQQTGTSTVVVVVTHAGASTNATANLKKSGDKWAISSVSCS